MAFLVQVLVARSFGAQTLGQLALTLAIANILACIIPLGFHAISVFYASRYSVAGQHDLALGFMTASHRRIARIGLSLSAAIIAGCWLLGEWLAAEYRVPLQVGALMAPAIALIQVNSGMAIGYRRHLLGVLTDTLYRPAAMLACIGVLALLMPHAGLAPLVVVVVTVFLSIAALQWWLLVHAKLIPTGVEPRYALDEWSKAAWPWLAIALLSEFFVDLDLVLVSAYLSPTELAILNACFRIRIVVGYCLRTVYNLALPDVYDAQGQGGSGSVERRYQQVNLIALAFSGGALAAVVAFGDFALGLFGEVFRDGHLALTVLVASLVVRAAFGPTTIALTLRGQQSSAAWLLAGGLVVLVALNAALVPRFGVDGAAYAAAGYFVFVSLALWWVVRRKSGTDVSVFASLRRRRGAGKTSR